MKKNLVYLALLLAMTVMASAIPVMAHTIPYSTTYKVTGSFNNQYFGGTITWNGNNVTSYALNLAGQTFGCTSSKGGCNSIFKQFKITGSKDVLAGFFNPNFSPFTLTVVGNGHHQEMWTNMTWAPVRAAEEPALMQLACLLALFAVVIPKASLIRQKMRS